MFSFYVTRLTLSRLKRKVQRQLPEIKHPQKDKPSVPLPTHLRLGSALCFPDSVRSQTRGNSESEKREHCTLVHSPMRRL